MTSDDHLPDYLRDVLSDDAPAAAAIPEPASDEDRAALAAITAAHARLSAKAEQLFGLASPPPDMLTALGGELAREIANFDGQRAMIANRRDLAAFPVMLDRVLADLAHCRRRAMALQMHAETQAMPWLVAREPGGAAAPVAPRQSAPPIPSASSTPAPRELAPGVPMPPGNPWAEAQARLDKRQHDLDEALKKKFAEDKRALDAELAKYKRP